jgi:hypothetical protein
VGKPEGNRPLGRPKRRWVDNINMKLREIGWDGVDWIDMAAFLVCCGTYDLHRAGGAGAVQYLNC